MSNDATLPQLHMIWAGRHDAPDAVAVPVGYALRTYRPGDEPRFFHVLALAGWPGWDEERLQRWMARIIPAGWYMAVDEDSGEIVATCMCLHSHEDRHPFGGELGWLACHPGHTGRGLGTALAAAVTARLWQAGYRHIHLYTEDYRLAALKIYLRLGYVPWMEPAEVRQRWQVICERLRWPYTPGSWLSACGMR